MAKGIGEEGIKRGIYTVMKEGFRPAQCIDHHEDNLVEGCRLRSGARCLAHVNFTLSRHSRPAAKVASHENEDANWDQ